MTNYKFKNYTEQEKRLFIAAGLDPDDKRTCCLIDMNGDPIRVIKKPPIVPLEIIHHPDAPAFKHEKNPGLIFTQLIQELQSPNINTANKEFKSLLQQAGKVNLWFYLKYIASYSGPYGDVTDHLHRDLANFRQSQLKPGARGAVFIPRSHYKSTVFTHGANGWELIRNPDLRIGLGSNIIDRSQEFMRMTQSQFDDNELIAWLYPEYCPAKSLKTGKTIAKRWNSREMVMPNRSRNMPEPSIKPIAVGGSTAGNHFDLLSLDDIIGDKQLDSDHMSGTEMQKITNWFKSSSRTLLTDPATGRITLAATRYAIDDTYEDLMTDCCGQFGNWDEVNYPLKRNGEWDIYYKMAIERNKIVFPEAITKSMLDKLREDDWWTYVTQYLNNPHIAGASEWTDFDVKKFTVDYDETYGHRIWLNGEEKPLYVEDMDVKIGIDPAASDRKARATTSRSAITVLARDARNRIFLLDVSAGYWRPSQLFDNMFRLHKKFRRYNPSTHLEQMGAFKILGSLLREEEQKRNYFLNLRAVTKGTDKDNTIRANIEPILNDGRLYVIENNYNLLIQEVKTFPNGKLKDILDSITLAYQASRTPPSEEENRRRYKLQQESSWRNTGKNQLTGY